MKLEFYRQNFEKYPNIKFNNNPSGEIRVVPCGRTDRQTDTDGQIRGVPRNFVRGGVQKIHLRAEDRDRTGIWGW